MKFKYNDEDGFRTMKIADTPTHRQLSDQALGAVMMALQNSLLNQTDIVPVLKGMKFTEGPNNELVVLNPPIMRTDQKDAKV